MTAPPAPRSTVAPSSKTAARSASNFVAARSASSGSCGSEAAIMTQPDENARSRSPAKERPTIRPLPLQDINMSSVMLKAGTKSGIELPQYDTQQRFAIELRDTWLEMPYGLDRGYQGQEPSFITEGGTPNSCLSIVVRLSDDQAPFFSTLDDRLRTISREKGAWVSMVRGSNEQVLKIKVALGQGVEHTQLRIVEATDDAENPKRVTQGAGWDFCKAFAEKYNDFKGCSCKLVVAPTKIWCVAGKRGATLKALQLAIDTTRASDSRRCLVEPAWSVDDLLK